jgi:mannose-1-phosphate guanylyltransferase
MANEHRYCAIMAGGAGTRFWPASRKAWPKPFINLMGDKPLVRQTLERHEQLIPAANSFFVLGKHLVEPALASSPNLGPEAMVVEPIARNTLGAVLLAMAEVLRRDPEGLLAILPADHLVGNPELYGRVMNAAFQLAESHTVCLGINPTRPETGYGYICEGDPLSTTHVLIHPTITPAHVKRFVEKPDLETASGYLAQGGYYWNSGMFIFKASLFMKQLENADPLYADTCFRLMELLSADTPDEEAMVRAMAPLPNKNIDKAVMELCDNMVVIPAHFPWSDVGSWDSLYDERDKAHASFLHGDVINEDGEGNVVVSRDQAPMVVVRGLSNVVVVSTSDAVLVCPRGEGQQVGEIVKKLKNSGRDELL